MRARSLPLLAILGCGGGGGEQPEFAENYAASFVEVRDCRSSSDHDLHQIRILADPSAVDAYMLRDRAFPDGAVVLKEERDFGDIDCTGPILQWTVMVQLAAGSSPATLDWHWQKVDASRHIVTDDEPRCIGCHTDCGKPPDGYLGTCAVP